MENRENSGSNGLLDDYSQRIEALGGTVIVPKMEIPGVGWWAFAMDPEGNRFAILQEM